MFSIICILLSAYRISGEYTLILNATAILEVTDGKFSEEIDGLENSIVRPHRRYSPVGILTEHASQAAKKQLNRVNKMGFQIDLLRTTWSSITPN